MKKNIKTIRVLQIAGGFRHNVNGKEVSGGVPSFLSNYCTKMDKDKIHFDFMAIRNQCFEPYRNEFEKLGSSLFALDIQADGFKRFFLTIFKLRRFLKENNYDVVHVNMGSFFPVLTCTIAAKFAGVKNIIAHSHSTGKNSKKKRFFINLFSPLLTATADQYCACSLVAAKNLFSSNIINNKKYKIINNAIDTNKFKFDKNIRNDVRMEFGFDNEVIVGHVGRFVEVKNHDFLVDFFSEFNHLIPNSKLFLLGDGEKKIEIVEKVKKLGLNEKVIFLGQRKNVSRYYLAMDIFVMPSYVEGFGIVAIEAQSTGLPCYMSTNITDEVKITELCKFIELKDGARNLAQLVSKDVLELKARKDASMQIINAGFNLADNLSVFEALFTNQYE